MQLRKKPEKKNQDFYGRYGNELNTSVLLKGFGRAMVRIVPYGVRGVPEIVLIA